MRRIMSSSSLKKVANNDEVGNIFHATNTEIFPLDGLNIFPDFISQDEVEEIVSYLDRSVRDDIKNNKTMEIGNSMKRTSVNNNHYWQIAGFNNKRRKQEYFFPDCPVSDHWKWLFDRIHERVKSTTSSEYMEPNFVLVEEHVGASQSCMALFEPGVLRPKENSKSYVAELTICSHTLVKLNKPLEKTNGCWDVLGESQIFLPNRSLLLKQNEALNDWRWGNSSDRQHFLEHQVSQKNNRRDVEEKKMERDSPVDFGIDIPEEYLECKEDIKNNNDNDSDVVTDLVQQFQRTKLIRTNAYRCISLKIFYKSKDNDKTRNETDSHSNSSELKSTPPSEKEITTLENFDMSKQLTIVVTTSPIRSNPSTEVLEQTFATFDLGGRDFAFKCSKVIICDGARVLDEDSNKSTSDASVSAAAATKKITTKHKNCKQALRNGITTTQQYENYSQFKKNLRVLVEVADKNGSPFQNTRIVELEERQGYGFALREALRHHVHTEYVCVIQHDRTFMRQTPMKEILYTMMSDKDRIKYVGVSMRSNLLYKDIFMSKYGRASLNTLESMVIHSPHLQLSSSIYGQNGSSVQYMLNSVKERSDENKYKKLYQNFLSWQQNYFACEQGVSYVNQLQQQKESSAQYNDKLQQLSLTPTIFWYDNTHIVQTSHYRDFIFDPRLKMVAKGGFVEDKVSPAILREIERAGLEKGHAKFGSYIVDDHSGLFFTGHLDGGSFLTKNQKDWYLAENKKKREKERKC